MRGRAGPSCRCGTTTSSRGWGGSRCSASRARNARRKRARSRQTRRGSNISPRASRSRAASRWSASMPPAVKDAPIGNFDGDGLGQEPNNLAAIGSLTGYRTPALGPVPRSHHHRPAQLSLRGPDGRPEASALSSDDFPEPRSAGSDGDPRRRADVRGRAGSRRRFGTARRRCANFRKDGTPQSILGAQQKEMVSRQAARVARHLEGVGQLQRHARHARGSAEPAGGADETLAGRGLRNVWCR